MSLCRAILCVVVILGGLGSPAPAEEAQPSRQLSAEEARIELDRLQELWQSQRGEIHTCDIRYRVYHLVPISPALTIEQFEQRLDEFNMRTSPERVNEFLAAISPGFQPKHGTRRLVRDGLLARYEVGDDIKVHDAECQLEYIKANKTITVRYTNGNTTPIPPIDWLREIPPTLKVSAQDVSMDKSASVTRLKYDTQLVSRGKTLPVSREFFFDATSGVPIRRHYFVETKPTESAYQLALVNTQGGVVFPSCSFRVMYNPERSGLIDRVTFTEIVDAQFNRSIATETFALPKSRGVAVFDTRKDNKMLDLTNTETSDIRLLIHEPLIIEFQPTPIPWQRRAFFIVNGLILIGLGVWLWRRVSLKEPKH